VPVAGRESTAVTDTSGGSGWDRFRTSAATLSALVDQTVRAC
jgi:hypothetical protein